MMVGHKWDVGRRAANDVPLTLSGANVKGDDNLSLLLPRPVCKRPRSSHDGRCKRAYY